MPIVMINSHYPPNKNKEVLTAWFRAIEKYPQPKELFTTLIDTAVRADKNGINVVSAYSITPGKYDEAVAYLMKFRTEFFDIDGYAYEFINWATIEEAMASLGQKPPAR
jgi:hypothetical protein